MTQSHSADPVAVLHRLHRSTNAHDVDAIVGCFAPGYRNQTPAHPARSFVGREQVRRNWTQILSAVPDLKADLVDFAVSAATVWSEWEQRGTRSDGTAHLMRGVIVFTVDHDQIESARFFLEPVDETPIAVDAAVRVQVEPTAKP